jgi:hypothetical protein
MSALDPLTEVRRRLDLTSTTSSDNILQWFLDLAAERLEPYEFRGNYAMATEAQIRVALKFYDDSGRGTVGVDPTGEWVAPAPYVTDGVIRSIVAGVAGPATATGGGGFA